MSYLPGFVTLQPPTSPHKDTGCRAALGMPHSSMWGSSSYIFVEPGSYYFVIVCKLLPVYGHRHVSADARNPEEAVTATGRFESGRVLQ